MQFKTEVWALIPARGGSKTVPRKNLMPLAGHPLISYVIGAAKRSTSIADILCSTDDLEIAQVCASLGAKYHPRPAELAQDDSPVKDALVELLQTQENQRGYLPDLFVLLQPTSPFVIPAHIDACVDRLRNDPKAQSVQTIASMTHNAHAFNQRRIGNDGYLRFVFADERRRFFNKQRKPTFYVFGNLHVFRTATFLSSGDAVPEPSIPHLIPRAYALDVDGPEEAELAQWYLSSGKISL